MPHPPKQDDKCPFSAGAPKHNLAPADPCPVCGDLGNMPEAYADEEEISHCIEPIEPPPGGMFR